MLQKNLREISIKMTIIRKYNEERNKELKKFKNIIIIDNINFINDNKNINFSFHVIHLIFENSLKIFENFLRNFRRLNELHDENNNLIDITNKNLVYFQK